MIFVIVLPFLGVFVYFIARGDEWGNVISITLGPTASSSTRTSAT